MPAPSTELHAVRDTVDNDTVDSTQRKPAFAGDTTSDVASAADLDRRYTVAVPRFFAASAAKA
jgi:hypothetical protein